MPAMSGLRRKIIVLAFVSALGACNPYPETLSPTRSVAPEGLSSDRQLPLRPWVPEFHPVPGAIGQPGYARSLTLGQAVARVIAFNPAVKAAFLEIEAKHGEEAQASVKPNPELLLEIENFAGTKDKRGFESAEETLSFTQTIELGDKRLRRLRAAHLDASLAGWDFEAVRLQTALQAAQAYYGHARRARAPQGASGLCHASPNRRAAAWISGSRKGARAPLTPTEAWLPSPGRAHSSKARKRGSMPPRAGYPRCGVRTEPDFGHATGRLGRKRHSALFCGRQGLTWRRTPRWRAGRTAYPTAWR